MQKLFFSTALCLSLSIPLFSSPTLGMSDERDIKHIERNPSTSLRSSRDIYSRDTNTMTSSSSSTRQIPRLPASDSTRNSGTSARMTSLPFVPSAAGGTNAINPSSSTRAGITSNVRASSSLDVIFPTSSAPRNITFRLDRDRLQRRLDHCERVQEVRDQAQEHPATPLVVRSTRRYIRPASESLDRRTPFSLLDAPLRAQVFSCLNPFDLARLTRTGTHIHEWLAQPEPGISFGHNYSRTLCRYFKIPYREFSRVEYKSIMLLHTALRQGNPDSPLFNELESIWRGDEVRFAIPLAELLRMRGQEEAAFNELMIAGLRGNEQAQRQVNTAMARGYFGQDGQPGAVRFQYLVGRANQGDEDAQHLVNEAIHYGWLGQGVRSEAERSRYLEARAALGDQDAQRWVNRAIYHGDLAQRTRSETERFEYLRAREALGDQNAQGRVNDAIYDGTLGQGVRSEAARFQDLVDRAALGDQDAHCRVIEAIYGGELGQGARPEAERFQDLEARAALGDQVAQRFVNTAIYRGCLRQSTRSEAERFRYLEARAVLGDYNAQGWVNEIIYSGELGQGARPEAERFEYLRARAALGDQVAQHSVDRAIKRGELGQGARPDRLRVANQLFNVHRMLNSFLDSQ